MINNEKKKKKKRKKKKKEEDVELADMDRRFREAKSAGKNDMTKLEILCNTRM